MKFKKNVIVFVLAVFSVFHGVAQDFPFALDTNMAKATRANSVLILVFLWQL